MPCPYILLSHHAGCYAVQSPMKTFLLIFILLPSTLVARADLVGHHAGATQLLLSGDGKIAFTIDEKQTRVWNVAESREMAALPLIAGKVMAASSDGKRTLCSATSDVKGAQTYRLWRRVGNSWRAGTWVVQNAADALLKDARFVGNTVVLLWPQGIERRDVQGRLTTTVKLKTSKLPEFGALSTDGKRALFAASSWAEIYDAMTGRRLQSQSLLSPRLGMSEYTPFEKVASPDVLFIATVQFQTIWVSDGAQSLKKALSVNPLVTDIVGHNTRFAPGFPVGFWFVNGRSMLVCQNYTMPDHRWNVESNDSRTGETVAFPFKKSWNNQLWAWRFSDNGKALVALDSAGDIWAEREKLVS